jgi:hypothetical protein
LNHLLRHLAPGSAVDGSFKSAALATALGVLVLMSWPIMPARGGDLYYPDRYGPYRYSETYDRPYRPRVRCYACGCSLSCGTPHYHRRSVFVDRGYGVERRYVERRYIEREFVERRYRASSRAYHRPRSYADDFDDVPRPPALIPERPASYYYDDQ